MKFDSRNYKLFVLQDNNILVMATRGSLIGSRGGGGKHLGYTGQPFLIAIKNTCCSRMCCAKYWRQILIC